MTHTPAPWSVMWQNSRERNYGGGIKHWEVPVQVGSQDNGGNIIAIVSMGGNGATSSTKESVEANACLIAAAPDLLRVVQSAAGWFGELGNDDGAQGLLDDLRAAIRKAIIAKDASSC